MLTIANLACHGLRRLPRRGPLPPRRAGRPRGRARRAPAHVTGRRHGDAARALPRVGSARSTRPATPGCTGRREYGGRGATRGRARDLRRGARPRRRAPTRSTASARASPARRSSPSAREEQKQRFLPADPHRRGDLVPAVLRARRRLGPREPPGHGDPASRAAGAISGQKVWTSRAQIADHGDPARAHRRRAPRRASATSCWDAPGRRHRPAAAPDDRRRRVQRGLPRRRLRPGRPPARRGGRRLAAGAGDAPVRARLDGAGALQRPALARRAARARPRRRRARERPGRPREGRPSPRPRPGPPPHRAAGAHRDGARRAARPRVERRESST